MSTTALTLTVCAMGVVTYASRALFLFRTPPRLTGYVGRFLDLFPLALFVSLAATGLLAPDGHLAAGPGLAALAAGAVAVWRRAPVWAVMLAGYLAAMVIRLA